MSKAKKTATEVVRQVTLGRPGNNVKIGIVGVPNVGKSSFFNLLSRLNVPAENFPFCTIDPNVAIVPVPDRRFEWLVNHFRPASEVPPVITITDIAGLVRGASEGAGLGNAFLSHIQACDAIYEMVRAFDDTDVIHVDGDVNPVRDIQTINQELLLKDIAIITNAVDGMRKGVERGLGGPEKKKEFDALTNILDHLNAERPVRLGNWDPLEIDILNKFQLMTAKEIVYLVNLSKRDYLRKKNRFLNEIAEAINAQGGGTVLPFSVEFEKELLDIEQNSGAEGLAKYYEENPEHKSALPKILKAGYHALQLIHFFTSGTDEVKAWTIKKGNTAPQAAGVIHTDFQKNFICAEVQAFEDLKALGDEESVKKAGKLKTEGKKYIVQDGDIMFFKAGR